MAINLNKWNRDTQRDEDARKSKSTKDDRLEVWGTHEAGRYLGFLVGVQEHMVEDADGEGGVPYVAYFVHKSVPKGPKIICLEHAANLKLFERDDVQAIFDQRKNFDLKAGSCPIEVFAETEPHLLGEMKDGFQYLMLFVPWAKLVPNKEGALAEVALPEAERVPSWLFAGPQIYNGLGEVLAQEGDITDPNAGLLVQITVNPKKKNEYYKVSAYKPGGAIKNATPWPFRLPKPQRFAIEKSCGPGKPGDPIAFFARMVKDNQTIRDQFKGTKIKEEEGEQDAGRPSCFGEKSVFVKDDDDCKLCGSFVDCAAVIGIAIEKAEPETTKAKAAPAQKIERPASYEEDEKPAKAKPVPKAAPKPASGPEAVPGEELAAEFGFVPHCETCGEVQMRTHGGMTCPNGHGGVGSRPPADDDDDDDFASELKGLLDDKG